MIYNCPRCFSKPNSRDATVGITVEVRCDNCNLAGPEAKGFDSAIKLWNDFVNKYYLEEQQREYGGGYLYPRD